LIRIQINCLGARITWAGILRVYGTDSRLGIWTKNNNMANESFIAGGGRLWIELYGSGLLFGVADPDCRVRAGVPDHGVAI